jgi:hypothetical protein
MSRIFKFILSLSIFLSACSGVFAQKERLFFIGQQKDSIEGYLQEVGVPDGFMIYTSIQDVEGLDSSSDKGAGIQHAQEYVNKYPECHLQLGLYLKNALSDILAGKYDANIFRLGEWIRKSQRSVYVRIGYEFDLPDNGYPAGRISKSLSLHRRSLAQKKCGQRVLCVAFSGHGGV